VPAIAVLGESAAVQGYALAGVEVLTAETPEEVRRAWALLTDEVAVVILTARAAEALGAEATGEGEATRLTVVVPG
jgi:vacuolar-type H+-ATPase subunit F/Vma7